MILDPSSEPNHSFGCTSFVILHQVPRQNWKIKNGQVVFLCFVCKWPVNGSEHKIAYLSRTLSGI